MRGDLTCLHGLKAERIAATIAVVVVTVPALSSIVMYKKTATDDLEEYIHSFEGRSKTKYFTPRVADLLSTKVETMDAIRSGSNKGMSRENQDLLKWINISYKDSLESTCQPIYNQDEESSGIKSQNEYDFYKGRHDNIEITDHSDELSNLPSPQPSDNELDSDQETIATDVLLSSYSNAGHKGQKWVRSTPTSEYPSWVENIDQSVNDIDNVDPRRFSSVSSLLKSSPELQLSESKSNNITGLTMDDTASIDTEVILQTSVYGEVPVNMGGSLHTSIYKDKRVEKILNNSRTKTKKHNKTLLGRSVSGLSTTAQSKKSSYQSPQSRDVLYAKQILNKHRVGNVSASSGKERQIIGKSVEQISQASGISNGLSSIEKTNISNQDRAVGHQRRSHPHSMTSNQRKSCQHSESGNNAQGYPVEQIKARNHKSNNSDVASLAAKVKTMKLSYGDITSQAESKRSTLHSSTSTSRQLSRYPRERGGKQFERPGTETKNTVNAEIPNRYSREEFKLQIPKDTDYVDQTSPRTSGYYSDMYMASPSSLPRSSSQGQLSSPTAQRSMPPYKIRDANIRRGSNLSQSSVSTDTLMRQPPSGGKGHQRSKTWASNSIHNKVPRSMSTPKPHYKTNDTVARYSEGKADPHGSSDILLSSNPDINATSHSNKIGSSASKAGKATSPMLARTAPSSRPHSAATARSFVQSRSQFSKSPLLIDDVEPAHTRQSATSPIVGRREKGLNSDHLEDRVFYERNTSHRQPVLTNWRASKMLKDAYQQADERDNHLESSAQDTEMYQRAGQAYDSDKDRLDDIGEEDLSETELNAHNRTWPSLERYRERSKPINSENRAVRTRPIYSGWAAERRSIPLRTTERSNKHHGSSSSATSPQRQSFTRKSPLRRHRDNAPLQYFEKTPNFNQNKWNGPSNPAVTEQVTEIRDFDVESTTADTEVLLVQPPMPIVDASPSLSTLSDDSTIVDSQSDSDGQLYADLPLRSSSRVSFAPNTSNNSKNGNSPLNASVLINLRTNSSKASRESIMNTSEQAKRAQPINSALKQGPKAMKSEILDSFIEDCMRSTNGMSHRNTNGSPTAAASRNMKLSGRDHPGTVETLKHMLLNLNDVTTEEEPLEEEKISTESARNYDDFDESTDDTSSLPGEQSLTRAYHHLERLKTLISNRTELNID